MNLTEHSVNFDYSGRYYLQGDLNAHDIWIILHGQGQLPRYFCDKFDSIQAKGRALLFPEGLNRYYLDGFYGRVGAGWMTKEDRKTDIENYLSYLNSVYQSVLQDRSPQRITILGFSQGAATASRWVASGSIKCHRLILWAGILPPDMEISTSHEKLSKVDLFTVYGLQDPYLNDDRKQEQLTIMKDLGLDSEFITFEGGHDIDEATLLALT